MTTQEKLEDAEIALYIAQAYGNKWKARAIKLAKFLGIRDCDIDDFEIFEHGRLIDVDEIKRKHFKRDCVYLGDDAVEILDDAPTVLDATMGYKMLNYCCTNPMKEGDGE